MTQNSRLSRLMRLSWDIQRSKRTTRSKALQAAWAICSNEDLTIQYLTRKLNYNRNVAQGVVSQCALFIQ